MDKINNIFIPYLIFLSTIFNLILNQMGISYLYAIITMVGIVLLLLKGVKIYLIDCIFLSIIVLVIVSSFAHSLIDQEFIRSVKGLAIYILFPIYWFLVFRQKKEFDFRSLLKKTIPWVYLIALLGIIQFFISPDLYGLIGEGYSKNIQWALESDTSSFNAFFRATSIFGSPQIFGLFLALYFIVMTEFYGLKNNKIILSAHVNIAGDRNCIAENNVTVTNAKRGRTKQAVFKFILTVFRNNAIRILYLVYIVAALLSGNKSVILILLIFLVYKFITTYSVNKLIMAAKILFFSVVLMFFLLAITNKGSIGAIDRLYNIDRIVSDEKNDRLQIYNQHFLRGNIIFGSGSGSMMSLDGENDNELPASESYLLQILLEFGLFYFILFVVSMILILACSRKTNIKILKVLLVSIFTSMLIVHAFNNPVFFIFWGVIMYAYSTILISKDTHMMIKGNRTLGHS